MFQGLQMPGTFRLSPKRIGWGGAMTCILEKSLLAAVPVEVGGGKACDRENSYEAVNNPAIDDEGGDLKTSGGSGDRFRFKTVRLSD